MPKLNGQGIALLADPTRRRIIQLLALHPRRSSVIAREIGRSRSATSRQLRILWEAGLVRVLPTAHDGRVSLYMIHPQNHGRITAWLAGTTVGLEQEMTLRQRDLSVAEIAENEAAFWRKIAREWYAPMDPPGAIAQAPDLKDRD